MSGYSANRKSRRRDGFTLVEVLVALVIVLIGAYAAVRIFPDLFAALERGRWESVATRLAEQQIERWRAAPGTLPEAIVWADSSTGSLVYRTDFDPNDLRPNANHPNWQPDSVYLPRTIVGEMIPIGGVADAAGDIHLPLCRLRFGPLQHLYDNPAHGDPLFIYTTRYERVDSADFLSSFMDSSERQKDWGRYFINYREGTISFDYVPPLAQGGYHRQFRVEFTYLTWAGPEAPAQRRFEMHDVAQMITVPADWDSTPIDGMPRGQGPLSLWAKEIASAQRVSATSTVTITTMLEHGFATGQEVRVSGVTSVLGTDFNGTFTIAAVPSDDTFQYLQADVDDTGAGGMAGAPPVGFDSVVPLSERVHQALIFDGAGPPAGPGRFALSGDIADPDAYLLFHRGDAGRTVHVDYRVRDWQILSEEREPSHVQVNILDTDDEGAVRRSDVVTITTESAHGLEVGSIVRIAGVTPATFNGRFVVADVPRPTQFTYRQVAGDDSGGGGVAETLTVKLAIAPVKSAAYFNPPRQPARDRIIPGADAMVIMLDTETGERLQETDFQVDYSNGVLTMWGDGTVPDPQPGRTYRIYYRGMMDWTVQPLKAAGSYAVLVDATPGYRSAVWVPATNELNFGRSEIAKSVVANYYMYATPDEPRLIAGEIHEVGVRGALGRVALSNTPAWGDIRLQGASMTARVLWAGRGGIREVGGEASPERWQRAAIQTFLNPR